MKSLTLLAIASTLLCGCDTIPVPADDSSYNYSEPAPCYWAPPVITVRPATYQPMTLEQASGIHIYGQ